ncbi:hypothetical protein L9F63_002748, partial [Diploptera punctata]
CDIIYVDFHFYPLDVVKVTFGGLVLHSNAFFFFCLPTFLFPGLSSHISRYLEHVLIPEVSLLVMFISFRSIFLWQIYIMCKEGMRFWNVTTTTPPFRNFSIPGAQIDWRVGELQ